MPAFRALLDHAMVRARSSACLLISSKEADRLKVWSWWRRGRVELPVQRKRARSVSKLSRLLKLRARQPDRHGMSGAEPMVLGGNYRRRPAAPQLSVARFRPAGGGPGRTSLP